MTESIPKASIIYSRTALLHADLQLFICHVTRLAVTFAALGYSNVSSRLLSKLNNYDTHRRLGTTLSLLWPLWSSMDAWPEGELRFVHESIIYERNRRNREGAQQTSDKKDITSQDVKEEIQRRAHDYATSWFWPRHPLPRAYDGRPKQQQNNLTPHAWSCDDPRQLCAPIHAQEAIKSILHAIEEPQHSRDRKDSHQPLGFEISSGLVSALDFSIWLDTIPGAGFGGLSVAPTSVEIMDMIAKRLDDISQVEYLTQSARAWELLKKGALAKAIGMDESEALALAQEVEDTVDERIQNGRPELENLSMRETLDKMETINHTLPAAVEQYHEIHLEPPPATLFRTPATETDILETEQRLGVTLPNDYKEFLRISNGFGKPFGGIVFEPELHPLDKIGWLSDEESYFTDLALDILDFSGGFPLKNTNIKWPTMGKAISIGSGNDADYLWLIPPSKTKELKDAVTLILNSTFGENGVTEEVTKSIYNDVQNFAGSLESFRAMDWCCVNWGDSMVAYPSFGDYLRRVVQEASVGDWARMGQFVGHALSNTT